MRKHEQTRIQLKSIEGQYQNAVFLLRRLYRDTFSIVQKLRAKQVKVPESKAGTGTGGDYKRFSDSINILNLSPEEIQMFVDPRSKLMIKELFIKLFLGNQTTGTNDMSSFVQTQQLEKFENELNNNTGLNATMLYDMLSNVIEERINLEKKSK